MSYTTTEWARPCGTNITGNNKQDMKHWPIWESIYLHWGCEFKCA